MNRIKGKRMGNRGGIAHGKEKARLFPDNNICDWFADFGPLDDVFTRRC
jgi:hypothetical protein